MRTRYFISCFILPMLLVSLHIAATPVKIDYYLQRARNTKLPVETRIAFYDSVVNASGNKVPFSVYREYASLYENEGRYIDALGVYRRASDSVSEDDEGDYSALLLNTAVAAYHSNRMRDAISNIYALESIESHDSLRHYNMEGYRLLAFILSSAKLPELAKKYIGLAWKEYERTAPSRTPEERNKAQCRLYFAESELYMNKKQYDQALSNLREAKNYSPDSLMMADICGSLGRICDAEGDQGAAETFYKEALGWVDTHPNRVINVGNYISLLLSQNRAPEAQKLLDDNESLFRVYRGANVERYIELLKYGVARGAGDEHTALLSMERLHILEDSIRNSQSDGYIKDIISEFEDRKRDLKHMELQLESKRKTVLIAILGIVVALAAVFGWLMWQRQQKRRRENQLLESRLHDIDDENLERQRKMEEDVELCNKEMMTMSMHAKKMQESLEKMSQITKDSEMRADDKVSKLETLLSKMSNQNNVHKMFGIYFSRVNREFFDRLFRLHPDLTQGEIRLCGYIQIGLSSKEIATLTNRSVRTVENIKYNLRKKLNISEPTESYIRRLSSVSAKEFDEMAARAMIARDPAATDNH